MGSRERMTDDVDGMINDRDCVIRPFLWSVSSASACFAVHLIDQKKASKRRFIPRL